MRVQLVSCWFATSYGAYTSGLRRALEERLGAEVGVVATNCGCGDPAARRREFQDDRCEYFELPHVKYFRSTNPLKYLLRTQAREVAYAARAHAFHERDRDADLVHFQQILNATGSTTVFHWLRQPTRAARVVTVHELDPQQVDFPEENLAYNLADRVIVHCEEMRRALVERGVDAARIDVVPHGVAIESFSEATRAGLVTYGGHRPEVGKGLDTLVRAVAIVKERLGDRAPTLSIHGHWGEETPAWGARLVADVGVDAHVRWLNQIGLDAATSEYRRAQLCVLPWTGSFAGLPAALALANGTPVIATRRAGVPDHVGDAARWVVENDPAALADAIAQLLDDAPAQRALAALGRRRAEEVLAWSQVAERTLASYERALRSKRERGAASRVAAGCQSYETDGDARGRTRT